MEMEDIRMERINEAFKSEWIGDLTSGKYTQTTGKLHDIQGYCCLGVACETYKRIGNSITMVYDEETGYYYYGDQSHVLPPEVAQAAGFHDSQRNPTFAVDGDDGGFLYTLAELNDDGFTFSQMADIINYFF